MQKLIDSDNVVLYTDDRILLIILLMRESLIGKPTIRPKI